MTPSDAQSAGAADARCITLYLLDELFSQTLLVKPDENGGSGLPLTREDWYARGLSTAQSV